VHFAVPPGITGVHAQQKALYCQRRRELFGEEKENRTYRLTLPAILFLRAI
jgi:hypothetical protein